MIWSAQLAAAVDVTIYAPPSTPVVFLGEGDAAHADPLETTTASVDEEDIASNAAAAAAADNQALAVVVVHASNGFARDEQGRSRFVGLKQKSKVRRFHLEGVPSLHILFVEMATFLLHRLSFVQDRNIACPYIPGALVSRLSDTHAPIASTAHAWHVHDSLHAGTLYMCTLTSVRPALPGVSGGANECGAQGIRR